MIKSGAIDSTVSQKPFRTNYEVDSFAPYPTFVNSGTSLVDKHNVDIYLQRAAEAGAK